jgi:hypothetical protein
MNFNFHENNISFIRKASSFIYTSHGVLLFADCTVYFCAMLYNKLYFYLTLIIFNYVRFHELNLPGPILFIACSFSPLDSLCVLNLIIFYQVCIRLYRLELPCIGKVKYSH